MSRIALLYPPGMLGFRGSFELSTARQDPRGMTGSEFGFLRIAEELSAMGHDVHLYTMSSEKKHGECTVHEWREGVPKVTDCDVVVSVNSPDDLRESTGLRVCLYWINDFSMCHVGFEEHVDLWCSPSQPHYRQVFDNPKWRRVEVRPATPDGKAQYNPDPAKWSVVELGCDPERYPPTEKVPGRVVYCSSPDRGLHWLLQEWPQIKRAVPHAHLKIFYRLQPWIDGFKTVAYFPPIERLRARALYIEDALQRMADPKWGITVCDSVSREQIEREMGNAEVLAYPCDTTSWSEGWSCATLEGCAARACPVILDCDALGEIYRDAVCVAAKGDIPAWREHVIRMLTDRDARTEREVAAREFAENHTWRHTAERIMVEVAKRMPKETSDAA